MLTTLSFMTGCCWLSFPFCELGSKHIQQEDRNGGQRAQSASIAGHVRDSAIMPTHKTLQTFFLHLYYVNEHIVNREGPK